MARISPEISVLTCCYNSEYFIEQAIKSVLQQTYPEFEFVLVDDGSTDSTLSILKKYAAQDKRIVLIEKKHSGLTDSLNVGLEQAQGEWIARLDADDIALPERLLAQVSFIQKNENIMLLGGGCIEIGKDGYEIKRHDYPQDHKRLTDRLEHARAFFPHSSALFNKLHVRKLGGYNLQFTRAQDKDLWFRIGEHGLIGCLPMPVIKLRKHSQAISNTEGGRLQILLGVCAMICHFRRKAGLSDPSQLSEDKWQTFLNWVEQEVENAEVFQQGQQWNNLRNSWYAHFQMSKKDKLKYLIAQFISDHSVRKAFWWRLHSFLCGGNLAIKLAAKSRQLFL